MNRGKWESSKVIKPCDGCSELINKGDTYLLAKFSLRDEGSNISRLFSLNLCVDCISDYEQVANDIIDRDTDNDPV